LPHKPADAVILRLLLLVPRPTRLRGFAQLCNKPTTNAPPLRAAAATSRPVHPCPSPWGELSTEVPNGPLPEPRDRRQATHRHALNRTANRRRRSKAPPHA